MKRIFQYFLASLILFSATPTTSLAAEQSLDPATSTTTIVVDEETSNVETPPIIAEPTQPVAVSDNSAPTIPAAPLQAAPAPALTHATTPVSTSVNVTRAPLPANGQVIVTALKSSRASVDAIEFRNMDDKAVDLSQWRAEVTYVKDEVEQTCEILFSGYLFPRQQTTFAHSDVAINTDKNAPQPYFVDTYCGITDAVVSYIEVRNTREVTERIQLEAPDGSIRTGTWLRKGTTSTYRSGDFVTDFKLDSLYKFLTADLYYPPEGMPLRIIEIYNNPPICASRDDAVLCGKYVKVYNPSDQPVDLGQYRLRAGAPTTTASTANTSALVGVIAPHQSVLLQKSAEGMPIYLASGEGTIWLQDKYGFRDYNLGVTPYSSADTVKNEGLSWAYDSSDSTWKWSLPSPDSVENHIQLPAIKTTATAVSGPKPCRDDQYRSEETGRCRNVVATTGLTPCKEGQYRSEETSRCRNIAGSARALVPCRDDQYRSETTNRCRNLATVASTFVPCKDNQYRSEETRRCRNMTAASVPESAFAVQPIKDTGKAFIGWWALGGVGTLAFGYAAWEWRREVLTGIAKVGTFFSSQK